MQVGGRRYSNFHKRKDLSKVRKKDGKDIFTVYSYLQGKGMDS